MDWLALIDHLHAPLSMLMVFLFAVILAWTFAPHRRAQMDDSARIPLRDDY
jgi:cbb3-type cytochrome oxidase subunit 3